MWKVYAETGRAQTGVAISDGPITESNSDEFGARVSFARMLRDLETRGYEITRVLYDEEAEAAYEDEVRRWREEGVYLKRAVFMDRPDGSFAVVLMFYQEEPEY